MYRRYLTYFRNHFLKTSVVLVLLFGKCNVVFSITLKEYAKKPFGNVLFIRHALASGFGDSKNFDLNDCLTQRNLDFQGRAQAIRIGEKIKKEGIKFTKVFSSEWCRCIETAKLMDLGGIYMEPGLNSFFQGIVSREDTLSLLRERLDSFESKKELILMVTHQVTITAMTGITVPSGGAVAYSTKLGTSKVVRIYD